MPGRSEEDPSTGASWCSPIEVCLQPGVDEKLGVLVEHKPAELPISPIDWEGIAGSEPRKDDTGGHNPVGVSLGAGYRLNAAC